MHSQTLSPHEWVAAGVRAELARQRRTQLEVAELLDTTQVTVSRKLNGHTPFTVNELYRLAGWLAVPVTRFLPEAAA